MDRPQCRTAGGDQGMVKSLGSFVCSEDNPYKPPMTEEENAFVQRALEIYRESRS